MWVIFLGVVIMLCAAGMGLWWIGNKIYLSIKRQNKQFELEEEAYEETKKKIKDEFEKEKE